MKLTKQLKRGGVGGRKRVWNGGQTAGARDGMGGTAGVGKAGGEGAILGMAC